MINLFKKESKYNFKYNVLELGSELGVSLEIDVRWGSPDISMDDIEELFENETLRYLGGKIALPKSLASELTDDYKKENLLIHWRNDGYFIINKRDPNAETSNIVLDESQKDILSLDTPVDNTIEVHRCGTYKFFPIVNPSKTK